MIKVKAVVQNGTTIITDEKGSPKRCAWIPPFPVPGKLAGSVTLMEQTCDSRCPFLEILPSAVVLHCVRSGAEPEGYAIDWESELAVGSA